MSMQQWANRSGLTLIPMPGPAADATYGIRWPIYYFEYLKRI